MRAVPIVPVSRRRQNERPGRAKCQPRAGGWADCTLRIRPRSAAARGIASRRSRAAALAAAFEAHPGAEVETPMNTHDIEITARSTRCDGSLSDPIESLAVVHVQ